MKRFILPVLCAFICAPAFAENVKIYIPRDGGGVTQKPGNVSVQEAAILMGDKAAPEGATGIVLERGKPPRWTDLPPSDVDKAFGGDGTPVTELLPTDDPTVPSSLLEGKKPIEGFPEENTDDGRIRPNAGNWIGVVRSQTLDGCDGAIGQAVAAQTAALSGQSIQGVIDADFEPTKAAPTLDWTKTGPNTWLADFKAGGMMRMQWAMTIKSPDLIENTQQINAMSCKAITRIDYQRQ